VSATSAADLAARAGELGLAVGVLPDGDEPSDPQWHARRNQNGPCVIHRSTSSGNSRPLRRVVDLSALWAGPLCTSLLRRAGAQVVTVESTSRPDGARRGDPELHRLLHDGNAFVTLDFVDPAGRAELLRLVGEADIVVSSARMRALQQLALDPFELVERRPGLAWVGISAYGLTGPWRNRIGYGDDTAVAGGLVTREPTPAFWSDAAADPITGLYAAIAALEVSASGGGVVDAALRDAAAHVARPTRSRVAA
jgi:crotonobetainyl-CoA:carnitine CoA-transferase CaiB-like acyl-CoA transferase